GRLGPGRMGGWPAGLSSLPEAIGPITARLRPHAEVLARRRRPVAGCAAGALLLAGVVCLLAPVRYTATARLRVEPLKTAPASQGLDVPEEVALLGSRILIAEVIRQLGLDRDPDFVNARRHGAWLAPATRVLKRLRRATWPA